MGKKLYPFQKKAVKKIHKFKGNCLLADEMGLGKTIEALAWVKLTKTFPLIIICPSTMKYVWKREMGEKFKIPAKILNGTKTKQLKPEKAIIINYAILKNWEKELRKIKPKIIIADEAHYVKNRYAKRSKATQKLAKNANKFMALTGTPITMRPTELWHILHILNPKEYSSFIKFAYEYSKPKYNPWKRGMDFTEPKNVDKLHRKLKKTVMIRRLKKDVLKELPAKQRRIIPLKLKNFNEYIKVRMDVQKWFQQMEDGKINDSMLKGLSKITALKNKAVELKMANIHKWINDYLEETDNKLVIMGIHKKVLKPLYAKYKKIAVLVDGTVTGKKRENAVNKFQKNKKCRLFIGNIQAAGVGITLTAAPALAFIEIDNSPANHLQAEDRIHRISQEQNVNIFYLVGMKTIEEKMAKRLNKKQRTASAIIDGKKSDEFEIFNLLKGSKNE